MAKASDNVVLPSKDNFKSKGLADKLSFGGLEKVYETLVKLSEGQIVMRPEEVRNRATRPTTFYSNWGKAR